MTHIDILCVGRLKERCYAEAAAEYVKRLSAYARVEIRELRDEPTPEGLSDAQRQKILELEAERLEKQLDPRAYVIALAIEGEMPDSPGFARQLEHYAAEHGTIQFMIGGSLGLAERLKRRADARISFSRLTYPHQLMRVILLEQIYRAYRIQHGAPYHK